MIVDPSALIAIARDEPEKLLFIDAILDADICRLSAGSMIELAAVAVRQRTISLAWIDAVVAEYGLVVEPVTVEQARMGQQAYARYGIGTGEKAQLNFGDCFAYALAKAMREPLLFKGDDFSHTDVLVALPSA